MLTKLRNFGISAKTLDTNPLATSKSSSEMLRAIKSLQGNWNYIAAVRNEKRIRRREEPML